MKKVAVWMIITLLLVSACSGPEAESETSSADESAPAAEVQSAEAEPAAEEVTEAEPAEEEVATEEMAEEEVAETPAEEAVADAEATEPPAEEATAESSEDESATAEIGPPPEFTADLKATNPDNVVLGNGKPQVVEFFAFW